jgi:predicted nuclease of predicted toxin-antitoxin system
MTPLRLCLDEDVDPLLARIPPGRSYEVLTTQEARRASSTDVDQLAFATQEHRALLTHNTARFNRIAQEWAAEDREHSGIVVSDHLPFKELLARLLRLLHHHSQESTHNRIIWLQDFRR